MSGRNRIRLIRKRAVALAFSVGLLSMTATAYASGAPIAEGQVPGQGTVHVVAGSAMQQSDSNVIDEGDKAADTKGNAGSSQKGKAQMSAEEIVGNTNGNPVVDVETGTTTNWFGTPREGAPRMSLLATVEAKDIFKVTAKPFTNLVPGKSNWTQVTSRSTVSVAFSNMDGLKGGDTFYFNLSPGYTFNANISREITNESGQSIGRLVARGPAGSVPGFFSIEFYSLVEEYQNVAGFVEFETRPIYSFETSLKEMPYTIYPASGGELPWSNVGPQYFPATKWVLPQYAPAGNNVFASPVELPGGTPGFNVYYTIEAEAAALKGTKVTIKALGSGVSPRCSGTFMYRNPDSTWQNAQVSACDPVGNTITLSVPSSASAAKAPQNAITFNATWVADKSGSVHQMNATSPGKYSPGNFTAKAAVVGNDFDGMLPAAISTEKTADAQDVKAGDALTYSIKTTNLEKIRIARQVVTTDKLPPEVQFVSASDGGVYAGGTHSVTWPPIDLAAGASRSVQIKVTVSDQVGDQLINKATNTAANACIEGDQVSVCEATLTTPTNKPAFDFEKQSNVEDTNKNGFLGDEGDTITYRLPITNTGNVVLKSAVLNDPLLQISDHECLTQPLAPGAKVDCQGKFAHVITKSDVAAGKVTNVATILVPGLSTIEREVTDPTLNPDFTFDKFVRQIQDKTGAVTTSGHAMEGYKILYGFKVTNVGNTPIKSVLVTDPRLGVEDAQCLSEGLVLAAGDSVECTDLPEYKYTVTKDDVVAGEVVNVATGQVPGLSPKESSTTTPVAPNPVTPELPKTGASGPWLIIGIGGVLSVSGAAALILRQRKTAVQRQNHAI